MTERQTTRVRIMSRIAFVLLAGFVVAGCLDERPLVPPDPYKARTSEVNVLYNLKAAYAMKDPEAYSQLLADDFRFFIDPETRLAEGLPESWNRTEDSIATAVSLFTDSLVTRIDVDLLREIPQSASGAGRERWTEIAMPARVAVDREPSQSDPRNVRYIVYNVEQTFYFRKGRNPADTLATSPTSQMFFLVEWDEDFIAPPWNDSPEGGPDYYDYELVTWSKLKSLKWPGNRPKDDH